MPRYQVAVIGLGPCGISTAIYLKRYGHDVVLLGLENTLKIHPHFRGQQVNFPMRLYSKEYIEEYLIKNYNGKNLKELSKKLDYTTNWLRKMLNKIEFS